MSDFLAELVGMTNLPRVIGSIRSCFSSTAAAVAISVAVVPAIYAQTDVLTWHNDNARTGQNLAEAILTPENVNPTTFGKLAYVSVDGKVDAQPLYVSALTVGSKGVHNVLYVETEHDSVYALDADAGTVLWKLSLLQSGETTSDTRGCSQVSPEIGVTATPVVDRTAGPHGTIYVVAMTKDGSGKYHHRIHALDLSTGAEQFNGPIEVKATYKGTGDGSSDGTVTFDPGQYKERPGLLLIGTTIYTAWGSHCDSRPYGGWLMGYSETTLVQTAAIDFAPNGAEAAPWNAGAGPAADAEGNIYMALGNGTFDTTLTPGGLPSLGNYGNSLVKVHAGAPLTVKDYWTMYNSDAESDNDTDLGSGGLMLLPTMNDVNGKAQHLMVAAGKDHNLYVASQDSLGHYDSKDNSNIYQSLTGALPGGEWSSPAYFNGHVYYGSVGQNLRSFTVSEAKLLGSPVQTSTTTFDYPGTTPSVSAYGTSNAIVWAVENSAPNAVLHAYDANNIGTELYNSSQAANSRDTFGSGNKFIVPTVANGKVYVGTQSSVGIFGLLRLTTAPIPDGDYTLTNVYSGDVIYAPSGAAKSFIDHEKATGATSQEWFFSNNGSGYYTIQNIYSRLFLTDVTSEPAGTIALRQMPPTNDTTQLWSLISTTLGYVVKSKTSGLDLDVTSMTSGQAATVAKANETTNEAWKIQ
jgi:hypothetical protein